ncbi:MAG: ABC transporter ATP-binding protein [Chloroflexi bacterium]|nr:ABC transporter ATP-binding protein [Chloroflexota bacterium]
MSENGKEPLIEVRDVKVYFYLDEGTVRAVEGVTFDIDRGKTLGVVGESGCGKSVTSQAIMQIVPPPGKIVEGEIVYHRYKDDGSVERIEITKLDPRGPEIRSIRGNEIAKIFQEPMTSLSPVHTMGNQIMEAIILHQRVSKAEAREKAIEMLDHVGLPQPQQRIDYYAHQLSGGMRQRAMIAMALSCNPSLLIADEPTTALDVTTEAQILELMKGLQEELGMAIMFITHNLGVIAEMADNVVVMYLGKEVELASVDDTFYNPFHPYTRDLLRSIPRIGRKSSERLHVIAGSVPDPYNIPKGCPYHPRCPDYMPGRCDADREIPFYEVGPEHWARCLLYEQER